MSRTVVVLALLGLLACKSSQHEDGATSGTSSPSASPSTAPSSSPSSGGHAGIEDATRAFAAALATRDVAKVRAQMPSRDELAGYFACGDTIAKRIDASAQLAVTGSTAAPKGAKFVAVEDTQTQVIDGDIEGCKVTEQILVVQVSTKWSVDESIHMSALQLVRLGKRWYTFDVPAE